MTDLGRAEVRLVLLDRFALVVENRFAADDPAQQAIGLSRLGLNLFRQRGAGAIRVFEGSLNRAIELLRCILLAHNACGASGMPAPRRRALLHLLAKRV